MSNKWVYASIACLLLLVLGCLIYVSPMMLHVVMTDMGGNGLDGNITVYKIVDNGTLHLIDRFEVGQEGVDFLLVGASYYRFYYEVPGYYVGSSVRITCTWCQQDYIMPLFAYPDDLGLRVLADNATVNLTVRTTNMFRDLTVCADSNVTFLEGLTFHPRSGALKNYTSCSLIGTVLNESKSVMVSAESRPVMFALLDREVRYYALGEDWEDFYANNDSSDIGFSTVRVRVN